MIEASSNGSHAAVRPDGARRTPASGAGAADTPRGVPDLVRDLVGAILRLVGGTFRMAAFEAREIAPRAGRRVALLVASALVAGAGLLFVLGSGALLIERLLALPRWVALAVVGAVTLGLGAAGIALALRRLGNADLAFPETLAELAKDVDALAPGSGER